MKIQSWNKLPREEQDLYLTILWEDNHSEQAIADFVRATKGQIVRRRQTGLKLPTGKREKIKSEVDSERFFDLLDLHKMREMEERGISAIAPVQTPPSERKPVLRAVPDEKKSAETARAVESPPKHSQNRVVSRKLANSWNQCTYSGGCGYERLPGTNNCGRPGHDK
jgi:hypothetical protein